MKGQLTSIHSLAETLGELLVARNWRVAIAESCTGGGLCAAITDVPGSSAWFDRGFIVYSNASKVSLLSVSESLLAQHGAVSEVVAIAMADSALKQSHAEISIAITGVAGPGGGTLNNPVGSVWIACADTTQPCTSKHYLFPGNRPAIRHQAIFSALSQLVKRCHST